MNQYLMLWPVFGQVALIIVLYLYLAVVKKRELDAGNVKRKEVATDQNQWPLPVRLINNNLRNQFETPILFYVVCISIMLLNAGTKTTLGLAIAYFALRCVHAFVHVTSNEIKFRTPSFILSILVLGTLFGFAVKALLAAG